MKTLMTIGMTLLGFISLGQNTVIESKNQPVIYRGFENKIVLDPLSDEKKLIAIEATNCEVKQLTANDGNYTYIVTTKTNEKTAKINFVSNGILIEQITFSVENLPSPILFWGTNQSGSTTANSAELQLKYSPEVALKSEYEIVAWICIIRDKKFYGKGNVLSQELLKQTQSLGIGELVTIEVQVKGVDGKIRSASGSWER